jgi:C-terminal processing protease CtpA/Prc
VTITYAYDDLGREIRVTYLDAQKRELQMELVVHGVVAGGSGVRAGLAVGDRIHTCDGEKATSVKRLSDLAAGEGFRVLIVRRGSQNLTFVVPAGSLGLYVDLARAHSEPSSNIP